ncbi:MAG TPA: ATP-binding cassette domain-containing protein [Tepidisphaeraceae bacterium]|nr:ATP-binding cassette domain-containing protein [Tepidisphaeraceae bacterium]
MNPRRAAQKKINVFIAVAYGEIKSGSQAIVAAGNGDGSSAEALCHANAGDLHAEEFGVISVSNLTKAYGNVLAVDNVSFEVGKGQVVGFLGPNGAGKSTTIRMLACYLPPTSGGANINGFDIFHQSEQVRSSLGYLPENCPLYTEMRVEEYLDFRGQLRKLDRATRKQRIEYVVERCWLRGVRRRLIGHLSKGYRQRVGLADSLLHNPAVLILDEPTVGLDPTQIIETRKLIKELGGQHTVLLCTHILPEVEAVCDRAIIIAGGRIAAQGSPNELLASRRATARVLVECKGPADAVRSALQRINGVNTVEILPGGDSSYVTAAVRPQKSQDVREDVARTVIQSGWALREIRLEHATLEEFFVQVTANQALARTPEADASTDEMGGKNNGSREAVSAKGGMV